MLNPPWNFVAESEGFRTFGTAVSVIGRYQADGAFVLRSWAEANSDTLVSYLRAGIEGIQWAYDARNKAEAVEILEQHLNIDSSIAVRSVESAVGARGRLAVDARFDMEGFENMLGIRDKIAGTWAGRIPAAEKYLDLSYYERPLAGH